MTNALPDNFRTRVVQLDRPGDPSVFSADVKAAALEIVARYPAGRGRSALLPILHLVQSEQGYVSPDGIAFCADVLGLTKAQVAAVSTFYTMYKRAPTGEYLVSVCTNTLCGLLGGDDIFATLSETLGVGMNQTTVDGKITLEHAECLAACDYAPVVTVNYEFFDNQTVQSATGLVAQLQAGERPLPTRGAPLCSFKQIERQIAGFFDDETLSLESAGSGTPTEVGVKLALERGDTAPSFASQPQTAAASAKPASAKSNSAKSTAARAAPARPAPARPDSVKTSPATSEPTSAHDAPLRTSKSDPDHPAGQKDT